MNIPFRVMCAAFRRGMAILIAALLCYAAGWAEDFDYHAVGKPTREELPNGGYKEIYKNKKGERVEEITYNVLGMKTTDVMLRGYHPNGQVQEVRIWHYEQTAQGKDTPKKAEFYYYDDKGAVTLHYDYVYENDKDGKLLKTTTTKYDPKTGQAEDIEIKDWTTGKTVHKVWDGEAKKWKTLKEEKRPKHPDDETSLGLPETTLAQYRHGETFDSVTAPVRFTTLAKTGKIKVTTSGTGETIGHVADLKIENITDGTVAVSVPAMVLESSSKKNQHYACFTTTSIHLKPHTSQVVSLNGVCLDRTKPPVGKGVTGDLVINDGKRSSPRDEQAHLPAKDANTLLRITKSKYEIVEKLQKQGAFKDLPYKDPQMQKDIMVQWSTWTDPRISEITGTPPATKEDLKKTVYKQTEETRGPLTPEIKKKLDTGIDTLFSKIELTTVKAKDIEEPPAKDIGPTGPINVSDDTAKKGEEGKEKPPTPSSEVPKDGTEVHPDGSTTTTTTRTDPGGATTTVVVEKDKNGVTTGTTTTIKYPSGTVTVQTQNPDGSHSTTTTSTDDNGDKKTVTQATDKDGIETNTTVVDGKDGSHSTTTTTINKDKSWTTVAKTTDKDGNTTTTTSKSDGSVTSTTTTPKNGSYRVDPQPDGSILVHWNLPDGTGGSGSYPKGTDITPNDDPNSPLPFHLTPPSKEPPPPEPEQPETPPDDVTSMGFPDGNTIGTGPKSGVFVHLHQGIDVAFQRNGSLAITPDRKTAITLDKSGTYSVKAHGKTTSGKGKKLKSGEEQNLVVNGFKIQRSGNANAQTNARISLSSGVAATLNESSRNLVHFLFDANHRTDVSGDGTVTQETGQGAGTKTTTEKADGTGGGKPVAPDNKPKSGGAPADEKKDGADKKTGDAPKSGNDTGGGDKKPAATTTVSDDGTTETDKNANGDVIETRVYTNDKRDTLARRIVHDPQAGTVTTTNHVKEERKTKLGEFGTKIDYDMYPEGEYDVTVESDWENGKPHRKDTTHYKKKKRGSTSHWQWKKGGGKEDKGHWVKVGEDPPEKTPKGGSSGGGDQTKPKWKKLPELRFAGCVR